MIAAAGIDSWSPCWYLDPQSSDARRMAELAHVRAARGTLMPAPVGGHRVGFHASSGLLYAEGHPLGQDASTDRLAPPDALPGLLDRLRESMLDVGVPVPVGLSFPGSRGWFEERSRGYAWLPEGPVEDWGGDPGFAGLRRFDATVDLDAGSRGAGLAILAGVAAVATSAPRAQAEVRYAKDGSGSVETVYIRGYSGVKILGRWYDKGLESGFARRGLVVRAEDQRRFPKGHRRWPSEMTSDYVRSKFQQRFYPLWQATKGVTVAGHLVLADKLAQLVDDEEVTTRQAEQLAGFLVLSRRGVRQGRSTVYARRKKLRELGLVVADGALEEVEVDLHCVLEEALDGAVWNG